MRWVPVIILIYIWLFAGLGDPGGLLSHINMVRWATYIIIPLAVVAAFFVVILKGKYKVTVIDIFVLLIVATIFLSAYINAKPMAHVVYATLVYLKYPMFFIVLYNMYSNGYDHKPFVKLFLLIVLLIIAEAVVNFIVFNKSHDGTYFTLGQTWGTRNAGIFFAYFVSYLFSILLIHGFKAKYFLVFIFLIIAIFIASIRSSIVFIPIVFLTLYLIKKKVIGAKGLQALVLFYFAALSLSIYVGLEAYSGVTSIQYRLDYIQAIWIHLKDSGSLLLGLGPRSMKPGLYPEAGAVYQYFLDTNQFILQSGSNQFVKVFSELGLIGFTLYWFMLVRVLMVAWKYWKLVRYDRGSSIYSNQAVLCLSFFGMWIFYAGVGLLFNDLWRMDASSVIFWVVAAKISISYKIAKQTSFFIPFDPLYMKLDTTKHYEYSDSK